jgi:hypothetical protein
MQERRDKTNRANREVEVEGLPVVRPNVAGIDVGSEKHWVCAPGVDRAEREVEQFGATTPELERMVAWLKERKAESWRWRAQACTGFRSTKCWTGTVWKWSW